VRPASGRSRAVSADAVIRLTTEVRGLAVPLAVVLALGLLAAVAVGCSAGSRGGGPPPTRSPAPVLVDRSGNDWPSFKRDSEQTASNPYQTAITKGNVGTLRPKWITSTYGVFAHAVVAGGTVYQADLGGVVYAWDLRTGALQWMYVNSLNGVPNGNAFIDTPAYHEGVLYVGDQGLPGINAEFRAIDAQTGQLRWAYIESDYPYAGYQGSPLVADGYVYDGEASWNEGSGQCDPEHQLVAFSTSSPGLALALNLTPPGETGADVWASPVADPAGNIYVATGNACPLYGNSLQYGNSILRLRREGAALGVAWAFQSPSGSAFDNDFGATPAYVNGMIVAAGKDGYVYALDANTGALVWKTQVGLVVGSVATDGARVYVPVTYNPPAGSSTCDVGEVCGSLTAINLSDGSIAWSVPAHEDAFGQADLTAPAVSQGIVFAAFDSTIWAFDAATGARLWSYPTGSLVYAGITVVNGGVLVGDFNNKPFYCFTPGGR
jgi:outer membrane protein assembly factor BamB